jgi:hypothetical protein
VIIPLADVGAAPAGTHIAPSNRSQVEFVPQLPLAVLR